MGTITKTGGTITGHVSDMINGNVIKNSSSVQSNRGHAVFVTEDMCRETTAGPMVNLDSTKAGAAGRW